MRSSRSNPTRSRGFTLVELLVVLGIILILLSLILVASLDSVRTAQLKSTQGLISSLDAAFQSLHDEMLTRDHPVTDAHRRIAGIYPIVDGTTVAVPFDQVEERARVIALLDHIKAQLPDVFVLNRSNYAQTPPAGNEYPLNFAGLGYPFTPSTQVAFSDNPSLFVYPLAELPPDFTTADLAARLSRSLGIMGATYEAAGSVYRLLGYAPRGYDAEDNDRDGFIDEWDEGIIGLSANEVADLVERLGNHDHHTARSEMLYALLAGDRGAFGSILAPGQVADELIGDTDFDGLPEFLDGYGNPLQFFRWPVHYISTTQRGYRLYQDASEPRDQNPYDPNQQLVNPGWWRNDLAAGTTPVINNWSGWNGDVDLDGTPDVLANEAIYRPVEDNMSAGAQLVSFYFLSLHDIVVGADAPSLANGSGLNNPLWSRGDPSYAGRRAYNFRPLILSSGQDGLPGVHLFETDYPLDYGEYWDYQGSSQVSTSRLYRNSINLEFGAIISLLNRESVAASLGPGRINGLYLNFFTDPLTQDGYIGLVLGEAGQDDIISHDLESAVGGGL